MVQTDDAQICPPAACSARAAQWPASLAGRPTQALERFRGRPVGNLQFEIDCEWSVAITSRIRQLGSTRTTFSVRMR